MNIRANLSWVIIMKQILTKVPGKVSVAQKSGAAIQRTFHNIEDYISLILYASFYVQRI